MNKREAKAVARDLAASWIESNIDVGVNDLYVDTHGNHRDPDDTERIEAALREIAHELIVRGSGPPDDGYQPLHDGAYQPITAQEARDE